MDVGIWYPLLSNLALSQRLLLKRGCLWTWRREAMFHGAGVNDIRGACSCDSSLSETTIECWRGYTDEPFIDGMLLIILRAMGLWPDESAVSVGRHPKALYHT